MEQYFLAVAEMDGYKDFEKEAWGFKVSYRVSGSFLYTEFPQHDRLNVERRLGDSAGQIRTSDIARLMELFQVSFSMLKMDNVAINISIAEFAAEVPRIRSC